MLAFTFIAPLLLALGVMHGRSELPLRKCRNPVQTAPVIFVDGLAVADSAFKQLGTNDIRSVEVICINPVDSTALKPGSTLTGLGAIVVWTRLGPSSQLEPALAALLSAQRAYRTRTGAYSRNLASLQLPALPEYVKVSLESTGSGWSANAWVDRRFSPRCRVSDGDVASTKSTGIVGCSDS
jgi:hypothetical protein